MLNKLYVFANMGYLDQVPKSGGQSSARRVMKGLKDAGFEIIPIRRHRAELEGRLKHQFEIMAFALIDLLKIIGKMMLGRRHKAAFLHLTYAGPLVPYELLLTCVLKMMGYKSLIYLKGGQVLDYYTNGSELHQWMFKKTMDLQNMIFFEGMESLELVKEISTSPLVYFPNYVFDGQVPENLPDRSMNTVGLLYFGRIAPNKKIDMILDTFELLCQRHDNVTLTLIGGVGQSRHYAEMIDKRIFLSPYASKITRLGITPFDTIKEIMKTQHFFLFPSKEKAEGHSNSLNEAMSQGLIPIVSDYHFNRSVVGNDRLIVKGFDAEKYANKVDEILMENDFEKISEQMWWRVKEKYIYSVVIERIIKGMKDL